jgi:hypothetical protein
MCSAASPDIRSTASRSCCQRTSLQTRPPQTNPPHRGLPHIADLIADGEVTIGEMYPVGCVAVANDGHNCLAMLRRRDGETLAQLLTRLNQAIAKAFDENIYTDEIDARS